MYNNPDELMMFLMEQSALQGGAHPAMRMGGVPSIRQFMPPAATPQQFPQATPFGFDYQGANDALMQPVKPRPGGGLNPMAMALLAAGLGTLQHAGPSPYPKSAGQAIGAGGLQGINTYAGFRKMAADESNDAQILALRNEQLTGMRELRKAQSEEVAARTQERQRIQALMPKYQAAIASGDQNAIRSVIGEMYPDKLAEAALKDPTERNFQFQEEFTGRMIDGKPEVQKYVITGRNPDGTPKVVPWGKPAPKGAINEITVDARSFDKTEGAERAKAVQERQVAAMKTEDFASTVQLLSDVLEGYSGGPLTQFQAQLGRVFPESEFGKIASVDDLAKGLIGKAAPMIRATGSGATSDFEFKQFMAALPSLAQTPDGRRMMADIASRMAKREILASDIYGDLAQKGPVKLSEWREATRKQLGDLFSKEELARIKGRGAVPTATNPQTGEKMEFRNGKWQRIP